MIRFIKKYYPIFTLLFLVGAMAWANYKPGTFLTGWDNLHPEFNFPTNIKRSIFAVWQEYQGLGLLGGMGHATDLLHQLSLLLLSFIFPISILRYIWTFMTLFIGSLGAYYLIKNLLTHISEKPETQKLYGLLASIFYLLNLATIQTYYTPFEVFTAHFAALPWLLLTTINYLQKPTRKNNLLLTIVLFLSTPAAYVPTLFLVYLFTTIIICLCNYPYRGSLETRKKSFFSFLKLGSTIFLINAFWLLPFLYFTFTNASVNINAKIDQMDTPVIYSQNREFGNITDAMLLKGFWFNSVDPNLKGVFDYTLRPWREHINNPLISTIGYLFFVVIAIGIWTMIKTKKKTLTIWVIIGIFTFTMLVTNTPPFSFIDAFFRKIPLFYQAFRFPFTKFSILTALIYAGFFAFGAFQIEKALSKKFNKYTKKLSIFVLGILLLIFTLPAFTGHLFFQRETIKIPHEYFQLFGFFQHQDPNTRIADFPQYTFWGWNFYNWGYEGSGFLWYGIKQPIIDQTFDPWSRTDENYYYEISQALYSKDSAQFMQVLQKYQINWLLVDNNILNLQSPQSLFLPELRDLIKKNNMNISKIASFGKIDIYQVKEPIKNYVFATGSLPTVNPYNWTEQDQAYMKLGNYQTSSNANPSIAYPFRSLFSEKFQKDETFALTQTQNYIETSSVISKSTKPTYLHIPSFFETENILPVSFNIVPTPNKDTIINISLQTPQIFLDNKQIWGQTISEPLFQIKSEQNNTIAYPLSLSINGVTTYKLDNNSSKRNVSFLTTRQDNILTLIDAKNNILATQVITPEALKILFSALPHSITISRLLSDSNLTVQMPKIQDPTLSFTADLSKKPPLNNCAKFRYGNIYARPSISADKISSLIISAQNATECIAYYNSSLPHDQGYALFIKSQMIQGKSLHFWILNDDEKHAPLDTYLSSSTNPTLNTFVLPPQEKFGRSYSFHFDNESIGDDQTTNQLFSFSMFPLTYNFLSTITLANQINITKNSYQLPINASHPNESLYNIHNFSSNGPTTLALSQSFDPGWKAYQTNSQFSILNFQLANMFPFLFGKELKNHILVNNWENGWELPTNDQRPTTNDQIIIVFLPQYLEYVGFFLLFLTFSWLCFKTLFPKKTNTL